jgi:hypothetical protein
LKRLFLVTPQDSRTKRALLFEWTIAYHFFGVI